MSVIAIQFEGPNAIAKWRELIGPTRPVQYALLDDPTAYHPPNAPNSPQTAASEIAFWFDGTFGQEE
ncbi:hypothetical protein H696_00822 [Fonticula alba]|uniref:Uncharacterized protein n=1 Tax=Fonticula alba TaxID=691883 RepID=A0A058ZFW2_FONAL|nr:hypothetical protein H696_00822 [Fonticula alba]KCV73280.1 hypothetical protein H696_00822 [Fonticula alba]|eukprot:XP_009492981.1 hypothetical protein H696_00822 [Fonticula alba]